jgi:hypothetical protein
MPKNVFIFLFSNNNKLKDEKNKEKKWKKKNTLKTLSYSGSALDRWDIATVISTKIFCKKILGNNLKNIINDKIKMSKKNIKK